MGKVVSGECGGKTPLGQAALHVSDLVPELETASWPSAAAAPWEAGPVQPQGTLRGKVYSC